jgi:hypothetical protein
MPCEGPKYVVKKGKMPVLTADEARTFLDSIPIRKATDQNGVIVEKPDLMGLRDRALIGLMAYSFARIGAALQMKVADISCRNAGDACASMRRAVERSPPHLAARSAPIQEFCVTHPIAYAQHLN